MTYAVLPGCEPFSAPGGDHGVLVLHGFTGNPSSMRPLAERFAAQGYAVELPRLPGHGTAVEDILTTTWADWSGTALAAYDDLAQRCARVAVVGLSMGGALTAFVAESRPDVAACVFINPLVKQQPAEVLALLDDALAGGMTLFETGEGSDVKREGVVEVAYSGWPLPALKSLMDALPAVTAALGTISAPSLVLSSREDHTVSSDNSLDLIAALGGPVEHLWLEDSYHVATIDNDQELVERTTLSFVERVLGSVSTLSREDVAKVARLARLSLSDAELDLFTGQLARVLEHARDMGTLDLEGVVPTAHPFGLVNVARADDEDVCLDRDEVLAQAPDADQGRFAVPRIVGEAP